MLNLLKHFMSSSIEHIIFAVFLLAILYAIAMIVFAAAVFWQRRDFKRAAAANGGNPFGDDY